MKKNKLHHDEFIAIVLCAGTGSRMGELTCYRPKPILKPKSLNGKSILQFTIEKLLKFDLREILVVVGHLKQQVIQVINDLNAKILIVDSKEEYKKGPLDSFLSALKSSKISDYQRSKKNSWFIIFPGDTIFEETLLDAVLSKIIDLKVQAQEKAIVFFREITTNLLINNTNTQNFPIVMSTVSFTQDGEKKLVKSIDRLLLENPQKSEGIINQVIPIFAFPKSFIKVILKLEPAIKERTLVALINRSCSNGEVILAVKIDTKFKFHDVDEKDDLNFSI